MSESFTHTIKPYDSLDVSTLADTYQAVVVIQQENTALLDEAPFNNSELEPVSQALKSHEEAKPGTYTKACVLKNTVISTYRCIIAAHASMHDMHKAVKALFAKVKGNELKKIALIIDSEYSAHEVGQFIKRFALETNSFSRYKTSGVSAKLDTEKPKDFCFDQFDVYVSSDIAAQEGSINESMILADAVINARRLVNEPACVITPSALAQEAVSLGERYGFEVEVHGPEWIQEKGLAAYWQVAKGSDEEPRFIVMRYMNNPASDKKLALIGKGMCYDSGGYAIKPAASMNTMQTDMAGSAAVINAMAALARTNAPVNVVAIVAACENMISGGAYRNGDIISSYAGKFIEVENTDAEGRLTLADAITYAWKDEEATKVVDIATLTGAVIVALGYHYTGVLTDDEELWSNLQQAQQLCGDKVWRLPIDDEYAKQNESKFADISNTGGRSAGTITAGHFLHSFAAERPFMHLDIAATSWLDSADDYNPYGATGVGTELLYHLALQEFSK